jgi:hypothetical protein
MGGETFPWKICLRIDALWPIPAKSVGHSGHRHIAICKGGYARPMLSINKREGHEQTR